MSVVVNKVKVQGTDAAAAAATGNPVQVGGKDGGALVRELRIDAQGQLYATIVDTVGNALSTATGNAVPFGALFVGGSDGTLLRAFLTDTAGRLLTKTQGPDAPAAAITGNPVLIGGRDGGSLVRVLRIDSAGQGYVTLVDTGGNALSTAPGSAIPPAAVMVAGSDGTNLRAILLDAGGRMIPATAATGTSTNVASSASAVTILAANAARRGATVFNDSTQVLFLKLGSGALATSFTARLVANAYYEIPFQYSGIITGIWAAANGNARVTELTA